jgi:hypothetical protein
MGIGRDALMEQYQSNHVALDLELGFRVLGEA